MPTKNVHHIDLRIPRELWEAIKIQAKNENRSINSQIITILQTAVVDKVKNNGSHSDE
jgi:hypothetical protein